MEFKGTKGKRVLIQRERWIDVICDDERITSFDKNDKRSIYDALLDAKAPEMLEMLKHLLNLKREKDLHGKTPYYLGEMPKAWLKVEQLIKEATEL